MATAKHLLKEASESKLLGFSDKTEAFLKDVEEKQMQHQEAKLYSVFIQSCLHTFVTKLKNLKDAAQVEEILKTSIICGRAYSHLLPYLEDVKTHTVPSFLYHVIHNIQDNLQSFVQYVLTISDIVYEMLEADISPDSAHNLVMAFHGYLWNTSCKILKLGSSQTLEDVLKFRRMSLLFLCCVSLEDSNVMSLLRHVSYIQSNKDSMISKETSCSIFELVISKLRQSAVHCSIAKAKSTLRCFILQAQGIFVEYTCLVKVADYTKARAVVKDMGEECEQCSVLHAVVGCYSISIATIEASNDTKTPEIDTVELKNINVCSKDCIASGQWEDILLLYGSFSFMVMSVGQKLLEKLDTDLLAELSESCTLLQTLCEKLLLKYKVDSDKTTDVKRQKELHEEHMKYVINSCVIYYKQLQLIHQMLETDTDAGNPLLGQSVEVAEKFQLFLENNTSLMPDKVLQNHRYNIGYVCSHIGSVLIRAGHYEVAASLYTIVVDSLHKCQQPILIKMYDSLVDCYQRQEKWTEGTKVCVQALVAVEDGLKPVVTMWARMKREALSKEDMFQSLTLSMVVTSSDVIVTGVSCRQMLLAEYQAWKHFSKRQYAVEYHILRELLDVPQTSVQKAEVMVALATNMCITGINHEDRSANEMLSKAIILLEKNLDGSDKSLAIACYAKYVIQHEDSLEYMKNESGEMEYFGKKDITETARFTLQQEQDNLPFLVQAIELWEKSLGNIATHRDQKSANAGKTLKTTSKKPVITDGENSLFDLEHHIDNLIMCGTRLIAMKQPQLALRALQVARTQLSNLTDTKRMANLALLLMRSLMLLGRYQEAESIVDGSGDNKKDSSHVNMCLLISELYMMIGKKDTGIEMLQTVLDSNQLLAKTHKVYLIEGTAKRLLSISLCLPTGDHVIGSTNQYLLSLAFEAVQCHVTVINFLTKNKSFEKNADKWLILNEILSSFLHLCQLCRFIGLPRDALCYLRAGLNISQGQGLPRWSCEFLLEMLGVQSMEAECEKALATIESLNCILSTENQSKTNCSQNQSRKGSKSENQFDHKESVLSTLDEVERFGFENLSLTPKVKPCTDTADKTPERVYVKDELDSEKKSRMRKLMAPNCLCMKQKCVPCPDPVRHRLCMKAGIVLSDFLAQTDMKNSASRLLTEVESKFDVLNNINNHIKHGEKSTAVVSNGTFVANGHNLDPQLLYTYLEAGCVKAETYLYQKDFHAVHQMWKTFQSLEQSGSLKNVLHSNILLTRLALCDATGYMLSLHETLTAVDKYKAESRIIQPEIDLDIDQATQHLGSMSISCKKKVSFENETEPLTVTGTGISRVRKKLLKGTAGNKTPVKPVGTNGTPKVQFSSRKSKDTLTTPSTNRIDVLEQLMASDDEDDNALIVFPELKPVTPRVAPKSSKASRAKAKSKTEPRNPSGRKPAFSIAQDEGYGDAVACKLNFRLQSSEDASEINSEDASEINSSDILKIAEDVEIGTRKRERKEKSSSTCTINEAEIRSSECASAECINPKAKSKIPKRTGRKPATDKTKKKSKIGKISSDMFVDSDVNSKIDNERKILNEKETHVNNIKLAKSDSHLNQDKDDVYDISLECSPEVCKPLKSGKGKQSKCTQRGKKTTSASKKSKDEELENHEGLLNKENESVVHRTTRGRGKRNSKLEVEQMRHNTDDFEYFDIDISLEEITLDNSTDSDIDIKGENNMNVIIELEEPVMHQDVQSANELTVINVGLESGSEPIELMRGDAKAKISKKPNRRGKTVAKAESDENVTDEGGINVGCESKEPVEITRGDTKPKASKKPSRRGAIAGNSEPVDNVTEEGVDIMASELKEKGSSSGEDVNDTHRDMEHMRSGRLCSLHELKDCLQPSDEPTFCVERSSGSGSGSTCQANIISSLELLYERLCQFPPSPQHSDVCHMLALHHLETDPRRAAFLLSDAMAVTFRHQVMLNIGRKARREAKEHGVSSIKTASLTPSIMFSRDDYKLNDMIKSIPEDWCVIQLSIVNMGLPLKQMVLTRFLKDESPIVLKLPGFSSPQGRHILNDFEVILERNAETAKIESTTEWWSARRKLDNDMENLVDRMEKHWLGNWRCAVLPGEFPEKIFDLVLKEMKPILNEDPETAHVQLLLLADKVLTEKEVRQCVTDLLGSTLPSSQTDEVLAILKKYSNFRSADKGDRQHTILILDKTVQHLPWESMPVLSDKSVSRMPCLSHLVTQLTNLQDQSNSVFVKGVNPSHTFYILNPDSDLPRTQEFFQKWFESAKGWTGVTGCRPSSEQFIDALTNKDFLIYCGHGSGGRFLNSDEIEKLTARAVTMLMGCSSGRLLVKGQLEPAGMMISYFLAGCPSMVANLWDVTDKDIDKFTEELIKTWVSASHGTYLPRLVQKARAVCKLKYLNGLAPVVYGLPVFINKGKK